MRRIARRSVVLARTALVIAVLAGTQAAHADQSPQNKSICIRSHEIERTEAPDDQTILFFMQDHKIWKNTLTDPCVGMRSDLRSRGFTYSPTNPATAEICSNLQTIRLNETGGVCLLGEFSEIDAATAKALLKH